MLIEIKRDAFTDNSTIGELYIDGKYECETLEDVDRKLEAGGIKIAGKTAIPRGSYKLIIDHSERFDRDMPLLLNVNGFTGVRIHSGNTCEDTHGCVLVGEDRSPDWIGNSRVAFGDLFAKIKLAFAKGEPIEVVVS
jgi:Family of unknown function (DUF5675)